MTLGIDYTVYFGIDYTVYFLKRTEKLRSMAAVTHDKEIREKLLQSADDYEKLAEQYRYLTRRKGYTCGRP